MSVQHYDTVDGPRYRVRWRDDAARVRALLDSLVGTRFQGCADHRCEPTDSEDQHAYPDRVGALGYSPGNAGAGSAQEDNDSCDL
jgi:hypothetical protein